MTAQPLFFSQESLEPEKLVTMIGDFEIFKAVATLYLQDHKKMVDHLLNAISTSNLNAVAQLSHKLSGAALTFGENDVSTICQQMEIWAKGKDPKRIQDVKPYLLTAISQLNKCLQDAIKLGG